MLSQAQAIGLAQRAAARSAAGVRAEMGRGLGSLAAVAATAPWLGLAGTIRGVYDAFPGCGGDRAGCLAGIFDRLSTALVPSALGLFVALLAGWGYRHLSATLKAFDQEMENAALELANLLGRRG